jgi:perosamine synthetase
MWRMGVPVATPARFSDILAGAACLGRRDAQTGFLDALREDYGHCVIGAVSSGRAALFLILEAMKALSPRDEVVVPAFVCPSVPRAVVKAGLKAVLCDVAPAGFGLDPEALAPLLGFRTLAVVTTHLFGCPVPIAAALEQARTAGAWVIEDAAQALGARLGERRAGTMADAGVISFGMSKVISSGGGLILAAHPGLAARLRTLILQAPPAPWWRQAAGTLQFAALALAVRSHHLGPVAALWAGHWRGKDDSADFPVLAHSAVQAATGARLYRRLETITAARRANAAWFAENLEGIPGIRLPRPSPDAAPVWLRYPVIVEDPVRRQRLLDLLRAGGVNVSQMYGEDSYRQVCALASRPQPCPATEYLLPRMTNLPTHPYVTAGDRNRILRAFRQALAGA